MYIIHVKIKRSTGNISSGTQMLYNYLYILLFNRTCINTNNGIKWTETNHTCE